MEITLEDYNKACSIIEDYKLQENSKLLIKEQFTWDEFLKFHSIKSGTPCAGDVVVTSCSGFDGGNSKEEHLFELVKITGYCLPDEFWGNNQAGKERYFLNTDFFKIIAEDQTPISVE